MGENLKEKILISIEVVNILPRFWYAQMSVASPEIVHPWCTLALVTLEHTNFSTWGEQTQFPRTCAHCDLWKWVNTRYHFKNIYLIYKKITVSFFFGPIIISTGRNEKNFESEGRIAGNSLFSPVPLYCKKCLGGLKKGDIMTKLIILNVGQNLTRDEKISRGWKFNEVENSMRVKI